MTITLVILTAAPMLAGGIGILFVQRRLEHLERQGLRMSKRFCVFAGLCWAMFCIPPVLSTLGVLGALPSQKQVEAYEAGHGEGWWDGYCVGYCEARGGGGGPETDKLGLDGCACRFEDVQP